MLLLVLACRWPFQTIGLLIALKILSRFNAGVKYCKWDFAFEQFCNADLACRVGVGLNAATLIPLNLFLLASAGMVSQTDVALSIRESFVMPSQCLCSDLIWLPDPQHSLLMAAESWQEVYLSLSFLYVLM